ncbi:MAG: hypothetical protein SGJ26_17300 [Nitrospirota bacterium]|nr:hypothetical protein [Nitrospirota bacterium]
MGKIYRFLAVLVFACVGLVGGEGESRAGVDANLDREMEMKQGLRDLWLGHIFLTQHVVLYNTTYNPAERDAADKQVLANAKQIASTFMPFYGEARSEKLFTLLAGHYAAVKAYSHATVAGSTPLQDAALARFASNADDIAEFLSGANPYLQKDTIRGLIAAHGAHHVLQINLYKKKDYAHLEATWPMMRQHVYLIADTLTAAVVKQFPSEFP